MPETEGHWRKLKPHYKGHGPHNEIVYGRTWVDRKSSKKEEKPEPVPLKPAKKLSRSEKDLFLWKAWKADPSPENLEALMDVLQPAIITTVNKFRTAAVPPSAIQGAANLAVIKAISTYDPNKGAALNTHVYIHLKKVRAFVVKHQNIGRIPEHRAYRIGDYLTARDEMVEKLGTYPDARSMAEHLNWSIAEVTRMETELRGDYIASKNPEADRLPELTESGREREVLRYIYHDLTAEERLVFDYSIGVHGKPKLSAGDIAKKLKISQPKVSRIRRKISEKMQVWGA